jgi:hypothetical protein
MKFWKGPCATLRDKRTKADHTPRSRKSNRTCSFFILLSTRLTPKVWLTELHSATLALLADFTFILGQRQPSTFRAFVEWRSLPGDAAIDAGTFPSILIGGLRSELVGELSNRRPRRAHFLALEPVRVLLNHHRILLPLPRGGASIAFSICLRENGPSAWPLR